MITYRTDTYYKRKGPFENNCIICNTSFLTKQVNARYCSIECRKKYRVFSSRDFVLPAGSVGAVAELLVSVDLMKKGYEVYRALSPSSSCDVLALKNNVAYKFEIRTGRYLGQRLTYSLNNIKAENLAIITFSDYKIHYIPDLTD